MRITLLILAIIGVSTGILITLKAEALEIPVPEIQSLNIGKINQNYIYKFFDGSNTCYLADGSNNISITCINNQIIFP